MAGSTCDCRLDSGDQPGLARVDVEVPILEQDILLAASRKQARFDQLRYHSTYHRSRTTNHFGKVLVAEFGDQDDSLGIRHPRSFSEIAEYQLEPFKQGEIQEAREKPQVLRPEGVERGQHRNELIRGKLGKHAENLIAAEQRNRAFGGDLGLEHPGMSAIVVEVVGITDNLAWSGQSNQSAIPIADRAIDAHVTGENACHHAVGVSLAKKHRALLEGDCHLALDKLVYRL